MIRIIIGIAAGLAIGTFLYGIRKAWSEEAKRQGYNVEKTGLLYWQLLGPAWSGPLVGAIFGYLIAFGLPGKIGP